MKTMITLTPSEVCTAIKSWVRKETGKEPSEVVIHVTNATVGYGMAEHQETRFDGATVTIEA